MLSQLSQRDPKETISDINATGTEVATARETLIAKISGLSAQIESAFNLPF